MMLNKIRTSILGYPLCPIILRCASSKTIKFTKSSQCRNFGTTSRVRHKAAYEGDGKTTVRVINQELDLGLMIDSYSTYGFRLNNGVAVVGPMAIFPRTILSWQVASADKITEPALRFFRLLVPKIDLLIIGVETKDRKVIDSVFRASREAKLNVEILPTEHACSTFNFLNSEARSVAGALIPPLHLTVNEDDLLNTHLRYDSVFKRGFD